VYNLNLWYLTLKFSVFSVFLIEYLVVQIMYYAQYARKLMTHIRLKFFMATVYLLVISIKPRAKESFASSPCCYFTFYENITLWDAAYVFTNMYNEAALESFASSNW